MSEALQTVTETPAANQGDIEPVTPQHGSQEYNDMVYDQYVTFVACGGMQITEDSQPTKMTMEQFCNQWNVNRMAIWRRRTSDKGFAEKVMERRFAIFSLDRVSAVWRGVMLKAMAGNPEAAKLFLANFDPKFIMPTQKVEHEAGNSLTALLNTARQRRQQAEVIEQVEATAVTEGEIVSANNV